MLLGRLDWDKSPHNAIPHCFTMDRTYIASRALQLFNLEKMCSEYIAAYEKAIN